MKKRVLSFLLALLVMLASVPADGITVFAQDNSGETLYTVGSLLINANGYITGYSDTGAESIVIPEIVGNTKVAGIASGAFDGSVYSNLKEVSILSADVIVEDKAIGYVGSNVKDSFVMFVKEGSQAESYAKERSIHYKYLAASISDIQSDRTDDFQGCYVSPLNPILIWVDVATESGAASEDVIWSSDDDSVIKVTPYGTPENGRVQAQMTILSLPEEGRVCNIYAETRSGEVVSKQVRILQPASDVTLDIHTYKQETVVDEETGKNKIVYTEFTPLDTFRSGKNIYLDAGWYVTFEYHCDSEEDAAVIAFQNSGNFLEYVDDLDGNSLYLVKKKGTYTSTLSVLSGAVSKEYLFNILQPAEAIVITHNNSVVSNGFVILQGEKGTLGTKLSPSSSTDKILWKSSNSGVMEVASDGTFTTKNAGSAVITAYAEDALSAKRTAATSILVIVNQKYPYSTMNITDDMQNTAGITSINVAAGESVQLYTVDPTVTDSSKTPNEKITWTSSNSKIAKVDENGIVTVLANQSGPVKITAMSESAKSKTITVNAYVRATAIVPESSSYSVPEGQTIEIPYVLQPSTTGETVKWISDDDSAVSIVSNVADPNVTGGYILTISALKTTDQLVNITGFTSDTDVQTQIKVGVVPAVHTNSMNMVIPEENVVRTTQEDGDKVYCVEIGKTFTITAEQNPVESNDKLVWEVSNTGAGIDVKSVAYNVASLSVTTDAIATITCKASGGVTGIIKVKGVRSATSIDIKAGSASVSEASVNRGNTYAVKAVLSSKSTDLVTWTVDEGDEQGISFSNTTTANNIATTITCVKTGDYVVRATAESGVTKTFILHVIVPATSLDFVIDGEAYTTYQTYVGNRVLVKLMNVAPTDTTDKTFSWEASSSSVSMNVWSNSRYAYVTADVAGSYTIKVTAPSGKTFSMKFEGVIPAESIKLNGSETPAAITVNQNGDSRTIVADLSPSNVSETIKWSVDDASILSVTPGTTTGAQQTAKIQGLKEGTATVTATTMKGLSVSIKVVVQRQSIANAVVTMPTTVLTYDGTEKKPLPKSVVLKKEDGTEISLVYGQDYEVYYYKYNINAGTSAKLYLKGIGDYKGTVGTKFTISAKALSASTSGLKLTYVASNPYTGADVRPEASITYNDYTLVAGQDYTVTYPEASKELGSYSMQITFKGNYSGTITKTYSVDAGGVESFIVKNENGKETTVLPSKTYTSLPITNTFTVYDGTKLLEEGVDYTVKYLNNTKVGTATIAIYGKGNYSTTTHKDITFAIKPASIGSLNKLAIALSTTIPSYTGSAIEAVPASVKFTNAAGTVITLKKGVDYEVYKYYNNVNAGVNTAKMYIRGIGNFSGSKTVPFTINPKVVTSSTSGLSISYAESSVYNRKNIKPVVIVKLGDKTLVLDEDYTVTYPDTSVNVGSYTMKIDMIGNYAGSISKTYKITAKSVEGVTIKNTSGVAVTTLSSVTYTGSAIKRNFYVYDGTKRLVEDRDFTVKYTNNVNVGTATITITGKGNYATTSSATISYTIKPYSLKNTVITLSTDRMTTTGSALKPTVTVKRKMADGTYITLKSTTDYTVTYVNNIVPGRATIKILPGSNGNFSSGVSKTFIILPKTVTGITQTNATAKAVRLAWTAVDGATGYTVSLYDSETDTYTDVVSTKSTTISISGLKVGTKYTYAVRSYVEIGTKKYYSAAYSTKFTASTVCNAPVVSSATSSTADQISLKWAAVSGSSGYEVRISKDGVNYETAKVVSKGTSTTLSELESGSTVYVQVLSRLKIGTTYFYNASEAVKVVVK